MERVGANRSMLGHYDANKPYVVDFVISGPLLPTSVKLTDG